MEHKIFGADWTVLEMGGAEKREGKQAQRPVTGVRFTACVNRYSVRSFNVPEKSAVALDDFFITFLLPSGGKTPPSASSHMWPT